MVHGLDIYKKVGKAAAYDEFIELTVRDGKLIYQEYEVRNAWDGNMLRVEFVKSGRDNPKVNGIVLVAGGLEDTHYNEMNSFLEQRIKAKEAQQTKAQNKAIAEEEKEVNELLDFEPFEQDINIEESDSLLAVITSGPAIGVIGVILLFVSFALFTSKDSKPKSH